MSWKGCARSEPCRHSASIPRSGVSTSSPTQVMVSPGQAAQAVAASACPSTYELPCVFLPQGHLLTLRCTRPWWSPMAESWGWTCLMGVI